MFIYKITNLINNKSYIGQTSSKPEARWARHKQDALTNRLDTHFARAIRKYGPENFSLEVIDTATSPEELTQKESYWIKELNTIQMGYNETAAEVKSGGNTYKAKTEEELKEIGKKISDSKKGGLNVNSKKVKCRNIQTNEEFHFNSQAEMQSWFNAPNHIFISRRCLGFIKKPYKNLWEIAFEEKDYGQAVLEQEVNDKAQKTPRSANKQIEVKNLSTGESKVFNTYADAERYFGLKQKSLSAKASKKPDTYIYKEIYQVTKHYT